MAPRIVKVCAALAAMLVLSSVYILQADDIAPPQHTPLRARVLSDLQPERTAELTLTSSVQTPATGAAAATAIQLADAVTEIRMQAATIAPKYSTSRAKPSAPMLPFTSVDASQENGRLASGCEAPRPDNERRKLLQLVTAATPAGAPHACTVDTPICQALRHAFAPVKVKLGERRQLVVTAAAEAQAAPLRSFTQASAALRLPTLVLAMDEEAFEAARSTTAASVLLSAADASSATPLARKWAALVEILEAGVAIYWADVDAVIAANPFSLLYGDSDVEALSEGWDEPMLRGEDPDSPFTPTLKPQH